MTEPTQIGVNIYCCYIAIKHKPVTKGGPQKNEITLNELSVN